MSDFESRVATMLQERAADARPVDRLEAVIDGVTDVRVVTPRRRGWRPLLAVAAALVLMVGGLFVLIRRGADSSVAEPGLTGPKFSFVTQQVSLTADDFWIEVGGKRFTTVGAEVEVVSDPGDATYQSLEMTWIEHGVEMRLNIYLDSDGKEWSSKEFRTYNGDVAGDWVPFIGDFFRTPLGSPFTGTLDETATGNGVTSHVHIEGMRLQAFLGLGPGGVTVPTVATTVRADTPTTVAVEHRPPIAIGESVMLGAQPQLESVGFVVNANESRQASDAIDIVAQLRTASRLGDTVVIHVGTNGVVTDDDFAAIMASLPPGEVRRVWFLTVTGTGPWVAENNARILGLPATYPNVSVGFWASLVPAVTGMASDGIHLATEGSKVYYADLIKTWTAGSNSLDNRSTTAPSLD